ncbi:hypothetical protein BDZ97DRAFT_1755343 [Flammula alnicola]|nr:hypothetical protein BDZ97DRAFT_1755343 [Flammula alnicola]
MALARLPPEILYDIIADIVSEYIDTSIACPPRPAWLTRYPEEVVTHVRGTLATRGRLSSIPVGSDHTEWSGISHSEFTSVLDDTKVLDFDSEVPLEVRAEASDSDEDDSEDELPIQNNRSVQNIASEDQDNDGIASRSDGGDSSDSVSNVSIDYESDKSVYSSDGGYSWDYEDLDQLKRNFQEWMKCEASERLPKNTIAPLLHVNGMLREAVLKVIFEALGIKRARKKIFNKRLIALLRDLRMRYRLSHTHPFMYAPSHGIRDYDGPQTPLINAYLALSTGGYLLRTFHLAGEFQESTNSPVLDVPQMLDRMDALKDIAKPISPPSLRRRVAQRAYIFNVRFVRYLGVIKHLEMLFKAYDPIMRIGGTGDKPKFFVRRENCPRLRRAVQDFARYDEIVMDKEIFVEVPRPLVKLCDIRAVLRKICHLRRISEFRENEDLMTAAREAGNLLEKWKRRCATAKPAYVLLGRNL